ncbi:unnamed protein product, partial [Effrenium voratum]
MGLSGNFQLLVRVCISSRSAAAFREKNSTHTDGLSVEVTGDETALKEAFYNQPSQLCHYWRHGECFRGDSCPFEHEDPSERKAIEDKYHLTAARRLLAKIYQKCCGPPSTQGSLEEQTRDFERCLIDNLTSITDTPLSPQESISLDCKVQECPAGPFSPGFDPLGLSSGESHASSGGLVKPWKSPLNLQEVELQLKAELGLAPDLKAMPSFVAPDPLRTAPEVPKTRVPTPPLPDVPKTEVPSPPLPETKAIPPPPAVSPPERTPASGATLRPFPAAPRIPPPPPNPPPKPEDLEVPGPPVWTPCSSPVSVAQQLFALPPMVDPAIFAGREEAIDARNAGSDGEVLRRRQELQGSAGSDVSETRREPGDAQSAEPAEPAEPAELGQRRPRDHTEHAERIEPMERAAGRAQKSDSERTWPTSDLPSRCPAKGEKESRGSSGPPAPSPSPSWSQVSKSLKAEPRRQAESLKADVTGLLVKNIPSSVLQQEFLQALRDDGFEKQIDYCSLPSDWKTGLGRGQAWLNFRLASSAQALHRRYNGKRRFKNQEAPLQVVASHLQGLEANLTRCSLEAKCREVPFVALDALKAAEGHPPQPKIAAGAGRVPSSAPQGATSRKSSRPKTEGAKDKWAELSKLSKEPESKLLLLESEAESETAQVQPQQEQAGPQAPGRRRRKKDGLRKAAEDFEQLLAEERSRHAADRRSTPNASANAVTAPTKPPASCCCLCGKPVPNLKHAAELSACKAHYRTFQAEERSLAAFAATRQKSDEKAPTNHLFHLSA